MSFSENITEIILAGITLLTVILTGAFVSIKKINKSSRKNKFKNIKINGNENKIVGGDDHSKINKP